MLLNKILLVINLFFLESYLIRFHIGPYPTNLQEVLIILNLATFFYATPFKKIFTAISKHWVITGFLVLTMLFGIGLNDTLGNNLDFIRHLKFLFFALTLSFIFLETFEKENQRLAALRIMGVGAIFFGIFSVIYNLLGFNVAHDSRLLGPLDAAVYLAYYFVPFFLFFIIQFFENIKQKSNFFYAIILGLLILATQSMGAIGGSLAVLFFYFLKRNHLLKTTLSKIFLATFSIAIITTIFYIKILPTIQTNYSSLDERGEIWLTSMELLKNPKTIFFGLGPGQFEYHYIQNVDKVLGRAPLDYYVIQPHNIFLLFIFNYGILGLIFILFCIYKTIQNLINFKQNPDIKILSSFILLYFFLHGMIDTPFFKNDMLILLIIFLELAMTPTQVPRLKPLKHYRDRQI